MTITPEEKRKAKISLLKQAIEQLESDFYLIKTDTGRTFFSDEIQQLKEQLSTLLENEEAILHSGLAEIKKRFNSSTYGYWKVYENEEGMAIGVDNDHPQLKSPAPVVTMAYSTEGKKIYISKDDANFIAHSKEDMEWLIKNMDWLLRKVEHLSSEAPLSNK